MIFLGIDAGTTSLKAGLFDENGSALAISIEEYSLITPSVDQVELDPEEYWRACISAVRRACEQAGIERNQIVALAVSSQGQTVIAMDERGHTLRRALVWLDNRAMVQAQQIAERFDQRELYAATGNSHTTPTWTACKIAWLKQNEPVTFRNTHKYVLVMDWLAHRLTGHWVTSGAMACSSFLWDARCGNWWTEMLEFLGIASDQLPDPVPAGTIVGTLTRDAADALGLLQQVAVVVGGVDQAAGAVGSANIQPGWVSETTGAALTVLATIPRHDLDPTLRLPVNVHIAPNVFFFIAVCPTGGMVLRWFRDQFGQNDIRTAREEHRDAFDLLTELAATVAPGCEGLTMLPHLMGAYTPEYNPAARGVLYGLTLKHTKAHVIRAILEANAFMLKRNLELMQSLGMTVCEVRATGGGAKSPVWLQIKADILGIPMIVLEQTETTILGNSILAAVAVGVHKNLHEGCAQMVRVRKRIEPNPSWSAVYDDAYARYCSLYYHLADLFE